jgi:aspartate/methionine/tyrosine aminotransferase
LDDRYISLGVGEPDFPTPERIRAYVTNKLKSERVPYTSNSGDPHLRELILRYLSDRYAISGYESIDNVLITVGASQAIDLPCAPSSTPGTKSSSTSRSTLPTVLPSNWRAARPSRS